MKPFALCFPAALALSLMACSSNNHAADVKAIQDNEAQWNKDYAAKDLNKLVNHYADDAILMGPGMPSASGKTAIRSTLQQMVADPALALHFQAAHVDVASSGDLAYTQGSYTID